MLHLLFHRNWVYSRPYLFNLRNFDLFEILRDVFACFFFLFLFDELKQLNAFRVLAGGFLTLTISSGRVLKMTALILGTCMIVTPVPIKATHSLPLYGSHPKFVFGWFKQSYLFVLNEFWTRRDFFDLAVKSATLRHQVDDFRGVTLQRLDFRRTTGKLRPLFGWNSPFRWGAFDWFALYAVFLQFGRLAASCLLNDRLW